MAYILRVHRSDTITQAAAERGTRHRYGPVILRLLIDPAELRDERRRPASAPFWAVQRADEGAERRARQIWHVLTELTRPMTGCRLQLRPSLLTLGAGEQFGHQPGPCHQDAAAVSSPHQVDENRPEACKPLDVQRECRIPATGHDSHVKVLKPCRVRQ